MYPRTLKISLSSHGYTMEIDTNKSDCNFERTPHWHLCHHGRRIGQISAWGEWTKTPDVSASIRKEAEQFTARFSSMICDYYDHNSRFGTE